MLDYLESGGLRGEPVLARVQGKGNFGACRRGGWGGSLSRGVNKVAAEFPPRGSADMSPATTIHRALASRYLCFPFSWESGCQLQVRGSCWPKARSPTLFWGHTVA